MHPSLDPSADLPQTFERRAFVRYARRFDMLWQLLGVAPRDLAAAQVIDLSTTGLGIALDRALPTGKTLVVRLPTSTLGWGSHLVRVRYCRPEGGGFLVGCAFVKPLSCKQLQAHLGQ
jgi:hypothetical protein